MPTLLDTAQIDEALTTLDGWSGDRAGISRHVQVPVGEVDGFLVALENIAREMNHDPDLALADHDLTISMSTHSAGGVTELDVAYARRVNELLH